MKKASLLIISFWSVFMLTGALFVPDKAELGVQKNYIFNGGIERGTVGFATYKDAAGALPVDGTGGSPTHITISASTTSPLRDSRSLNIVNSGSTSAQGEGASYDFSVDSSDQASVINVSFDYSLVSGTFIAGSISGSTITDSDIEMFVYDVTNAAVIQPSGYILTCGAVVGTKCTNPSVQFQSASNSTSYRLIFHVPTTHTVAWTMKIDNIVATRQVKQYGSPITDWASSPAVTPSAGFGTTTASVIKTRRNGDSLEAFGSFTAGTSAASTASLSIPFAIDTTKIQTGSAVQKVGFWTQVTNTGQSLTTATITGDLFFDGSDTGNIYFATQVGTKVYTKFNVSASIVSTTPVTFYLTVPVTGWSSNVQMSDSADTRVVSLTANKSAGSVTANTTIPTWTNVTKDTHGAFNATTGVFTCPVAGDYQVNFTAYTTTGSPVGQIRKNGTLVVTGVTGAVVNSGTVSGLVSNCNSGETISVSVDSSLTLTTSTVQTTLAIYRLSGPASIAASETVSASYFVSANFAASTTVPINFDTKEFDTHNAVTTSPTAWKFTAPISGKYSIQGACSASAAQFAVLYKSGSAYKHIGGVAGVANGMGIFNSVVSLLAGDPIDIRPAVATTIAGSTLATAGTCNVAITRIGL